MQLCGGENIGKFGYHLLFTIKNIYYCLTIITIAWLNYVDSKEETKEELMNSVNVFLWIKSRYIGLLIVSVQIL